MGGLSRRKVWKDIRKTGRTYESHEQGRDFNRRGDRSYHADGTTVGYESDTEGNDAAKIFSKGLYSKNKCREIIIQLLEGWKHEHERDGFKLVK